MYTLHLFFYLGSTDGTKTELIDLFKPKIINYTLFYLLK